MDREARIQTIKEALEEPLEEALLRATAIGFSQDEASEAILQWAAESLLKIRRSLIDVDRALRDAGREVAELAE